MSDNESADTARLAPARRWRISPVWLVPLFAVLVGGWLLYDNLSSRGPVITLDIDTAEGIEAGSTKLKVRSVDVGQVSQIELADDYNGAVLTVQMNPDTAKLLGPDTKFWVVKPRVGPQGISGLNTILSGAYLQLRPSQKPGDKRHFKVRDNPPPLSTNQPGVTVKLVNDGDNTLSVGDPIVYQGQNVGQIEASNFSIEKRQTIYTVFIRKPFSELITGPTQFWLRSGVDLHLGSDGVDVQLGSLQSVLAGGVTFGLPDGVDAGKSVADGDRFKLYQTRNAAIQDRFERKLKYVVLLNDSIRGLSAGAPVEYRGLRIGTVEEVPFYPSDYTLSSFSGFRIPVLIAIEPQRRGLAWANWTDKEWRAHQIRFFKNGLRATIKSSNLLTGSMFIDLSFDKHADSYQQQTLGGYTIFPSEPSQITSIQQQLSDLMDKLNQIDVGPIVRQLKHSISQANATISALHQTTNKVNGLLDEPGTRQLPGQINDTLDKLQQTLDNFQQGAPAYQQLNETLQRLNQVLDDAAPLTRTLRDHPNSLVFGRPDGKDPVPRAKP
ncbi:intermembrane transport protein PqiB [Salinisphaera sp. Q1T1-3]|uniref:intermembrane transport protein PqiB n=1 Tax=Salinisphaera sp. Q1T1-3 TaxID=2321229 RepID=UPI000E724D3E|nr:intermembrane transport protein PqiB [Salinisphaera sp. Q1T1-3]RJS94313.1 MCE family protein [Salinisphaera sp. Q1T1-3]